MKKRALCLHVHVHVMYLHVYVYMYLYVLYKNKLLYTNSILFFPPGSMYRIRDYMVQEIHKGQSDYKVNMAFEVKPHDQWGRLLLGVHVNVMF